MTDSIRRFADEYRWLSNFWPVEIVLTDGIYPSVEHAYQAEKTETDSERLRIRTATSPGIAKRLGRKVHLRRDWDAVKIDVMRELLRQKFSNNLGLRARLLSTGDCAIIEGNDWGDTFWGVCRGSGENHLGKLIMEVRKELRAGRR